MSKIHSWLPLTIIKFPIKIGEGLNGFLHNKYQIRIPYMFSNPKDAEFQINVKATP
jgi:hypothetical protein